MNFATLATACASSLLLPSLLQAQEAAVWDPGGLSGSLAGSVFTVSGLTNSHFNPTMDFSGADFGAGELGSVPCLSYSTADTVTISFAPPIQDPSVYALFWRGNQGTGVGVSYTFGQAPNLLSGFTQATLAGVMLDCPSPIFTTVSWSFPGSFRPSPSATLRIAVPSKS